VQGAPSHAKATSTPATQKGLTTAVGPFLSAARCMACPQSSEPTLQCPDRRAGFAPLRPCPGGLIQYLVGGGQQRPRDGEVRRLCSFEDILQFSQTYAPGNQRTRLRLAKRLTSDLWLAPTSFCSGLGPSLGAALPFEGGFYLARRHTNGRTAPPPDGAVLVYLSSSPAIERLTRF
jgi:hypothetical protein